MQPREAGNTARLQLGEPHMLRELAEVRAEDYATRRADAERPFLLVPRRSNNFMNSSGRSLAKLTRGRPYNPAFVHPDDLAALGIASGESVEIRSAHDAIWAVVEADDTLRRGVVAMTHAFGGHPDEDHRASRDRQQHRPSDGRRPRVRSDQRDAENGRAADRDRAAEVGSTDGPRRARLSSGAMRARLSLAERHARRSVRSIRAP